MYKNPEKIVLQPGWKGWRLQFRSKLFQVDTSTFRFRESKRSQQLGHPQLNSIFRKLLFFAVPFELIQLRRLISDVICIIKRLVPKWEDPENSGRRRMRRRQGRWFGPLYIPVSRSQLFFFSPTCPYFFQHEPCSSFISFRNFIFISNWMLQLKWTIYILCVQVELWLATRKSASLYSPPPGLASLQAAT